MKSFRKLAVILLAIIMVTALFACGGKPGGKEPPIIQTGELTPSTMKLELQDIPDYSKQAQNWDPAKISYQDTSAQEAKLDARIKQKQEDYEENPDVASIVKIFINSKATEIIDYMARAALPVGKMEATVDYLAGEENVTTDQIEAIVNDLVNNGKKLDVKQTNGWSFFDDWELYDKLQEVADGTNSHDSDKDNVKRQYRNMARKIFEIGMTGAEFGRVATQELLYATLVVNKMAGEDISLDSTYNTKFNNYCREALDYETLVYLRAFNMLYSDKSSYDPDLHKDGKKNCVKLYAYYYEYGYNDYKSQTDDEFEKQLEYGHYESGEMSNEQWLDYVDLQRKSYIKAYRYSNTFYKDFYITHLNFQGIVEDQELIVYNIIKWNNLSYTDEMRKALNPENQYAGLTGQLNFTDWLYCYSADKTVMTEYNDAARQKYQAEHNNQSVERQKEGEFQVNMQQLKAVYYLLDKMSAANLTNTLYFQVYSYSGEVAKTGQQYTKNQVLIKVGQKYAEDVVAIEQGLTGSDVTAFADGKLDVLKNQLTSNYGKAKVTDNAAGAKDVDWAAIKVTVKETIDADYSSLKGQAKVDKMEQTLIRKKYKNCGAIVGTTDQCSKNPGNGHVDEYGTPEAEEYDTSHKLSLFLNDYQIILRYMAGQATLSFQGQAATTATAKNAYEIKVYDLSVKNTWTVGYKGDLQSVETEGKPVFTEIRSVSAQAGEKLLSSKNGETDKKWWQAGSSDSSGSCPARAKWHVTETASGVSGATGPYTYTYEFAGWYLDQACKFEFNENDTISFDLTLYAGYNIKKEKGTK